MTPSLAPAAEKTPTLPVVLWLCSSALLSLGLTRPVIQIDVNIEGVLRDALDRQPAIGLLLQERGFKLADVASKLPPTNSTRQSVVSSAMKLYRLKCFTAATLILLFSIVVPLGKQAVLLFVLLSPDGNSKNLVSAASALHKWAMLDVFVLSMVVLALSSATAWNALLLDGFYWFLGYVFTAGVLAVLLSRRVKLSLHASANHQPNEPLREVNRV
jgi:hypothetical protein